MIMTYPFYTNKFSVILRHVLKGESKRSEIM